MRVALVGEAPFDTDSITNLLMQRWNKNIEYFSLLKRIRGSNLDNQKTKRLLRKEYALQKPDIVIFIRDLDGLKTDKHQVKIRKDYFTQQNSVVDKKGCYLLIIYEIEALILQDINTFNTLYNTKITLDADAIDIAEPKEFLVNKCKTYSILDNPKIFKKLNIDVLKQHQSFNNFLAVFTKQINAVNL